MSEFGSPLNTFHNPAVRDYLGHDAGMMQQYFGVTVRAFVKPDEEGAAAIVLSGQDARTRGNIVLGEVLIDKRKNQRAGLLRLAAVLAHEASHIFQMASGTDAHLLGRCGYEKKMVELHADYLAGCYIAHRGQRMAIAPQEVTRLFYELGDDDLTDPEHHGTPPERAHAITQGYVETRQAFGQGRGAVRHAAARGLLYVGKLCG